MINVKKGLAYSLAQISKVAPLTTPDTVAGVPTATSVFAGQVVAFASGKLVKCDGDTHKAALTGFAARNSYDADVIAAQGNNVFLLDGASIIETDQVQDTINASNFPLGAPVYAGTGQYAGLVTKTAPAVGAKILGWVEDIRTIPAAEVYTMLGSQPSTVIPGYTSMTVLSIKLNA